MDGEPDNYEPEEMPEFVSTIPAHLVRDLDEKDKYLVETLCKIEAQTAWLAKRVGRASSVHKELHDRVSSIELWRTQLTSKWVVVAFFGSTIFIPMIVYVLTRKLFP